MNYATIAMAALALLGTQALAGEPGLIVGATTHFHQSKGDIDLNLEMLKRGGIASIRDETTWSACEKEKGRIVIPDVLPAYMAKAGKLGLAPLFILDYSNKNYDGGGYPKSPEAQEGYARYAEAIVSALKGGCKLYQVWNEWDGGCGMKDFRGQGDAESYVKLLARVYPRLKAVDPSITVMSGSVCTGDKYLQSLLDLGLLKHCDAVSLHTYNCGRPDGTPEKWLERMQGVDAMLKAANGGKEVPLYVTEMGWPTQLSGRGRTQAESADYLVRLYLLAKTLPFLKGLYWYDFQDDGWDAMDSQHNYGLVRADLTPKKQFFALKDVSAFIAQARYEGRLDAGDPKIWMLKFKESDGRSSLALWSAYPDDDYQVTLKAEGAALKAPVEVLRPGEGSVMRSFGVREWAADRSAKLDGSLFQLAFRGSPFILRGDLGNAKVVKLEKKDFKESERAKSAIVRVPEKIASVKRKGSPETAKAIPFGDESDYRRTSAEAKSGLDASFSVAWDESALYVSATVEDDVFVQNGEGEATWTGDGVQAAFQALSGGGKDAKPALELDAALTKNGPALYRQSPNPGPEKDAALKTRQEGGKTFYELKIPAAKLGLEALKPDDVIGFSILVNDNDGKGRKGYLHWGAGIGHSKDPAEYNWLHLEN